jgi:hypothetical protein
MKKIEIDGIKPIIYEDGSIRIPVKDMHVCSDPMDITFLYKESKKALIERQLEVKEMKLTEQSFERRRFKRHKVKRRPIAVLGPEPVRVGHVTIISDEAAEIQFSETNGKKATRFSELVVLVPDYNNPFLFDAILIFSGPKTAL